ncbi:MAG: protein kinase domain-containing protein [Micromonosporaceae bacterium]
MNRLSELQVIGVLSQDALAKQLAAHDHAGHPVLLTTSSQKLHQGEPAAFTAWAERLAACSVHPNLGEVFGYGVADDHAYLAVRTGSRRTLAELLEVNGSLAADQVRAIGSALADGLAVVHEAGLCHLAVRAEVIFVDDEEAPTLVGFDAGAPGLTRPMAAGQLSAPEYRIPRGTLDGQGPVVSPAVDVYALAVTLYLALGGTLPWAPKPDNSAPSVVDESVERALRNVPLPDLPGAPAALVQTLRQAVAAQPANRLTAEQLRDELLRPTPRTSPASTPTDGVLETAIAVHGAHMPAAAIPLAPPPTPASEHDDRPVDHAASEVPQGPTVVAEPSPDLGLAPLVGMWRMTSDSGESEVLQVAETGAVTWTGTDEMGPFVATGEALPAGGGSFRLLLNEPAGAAGFYVDLQIEADGLSFVLPGSPADAMVDANPAE